MALAASFLLSIGTAITEIYPKTLFSTGIENQVAFDCGATIKNISITKPHSYYVTLTFDTTSLCTTPNLRLAVLFKSKDGNYINLGSYAMPTSKKDTYYKIKIQAKINDFENASSMIIAAYGDNDITNLIPVTTSNKDAAGIRAIFEFPAKI